MMSQSPRPQPALPTVIVGASRQGTVVRRILEEQGGFHLLGFLDDDPAKHGAEFDGLRVLGGTAWAADEAASGTCAFVAIGNNDARVQVANKLRSHGITLINARHPSAVVMANVKFGTGILVCAGAVLITGTRLEDDVVVNTGATVDHDSRLEPGCYLAPGVRTAGAVNVGRGAFIGLGALLGPGVRIGEGTIVGAGAVVLRDLPPRVFAAGTPAKVIKQLDKPVQWRKILGGA